MLPPYGLLLFEAELVQRTLADLTPCPMRVTRQGSFIPKFSLCGMVRSNSGAVGGTTCGRYRPDRYPAAAARPGGLDAADVRARDRHANHGCRRLHLVLVCPSATALVGGTLACWAPHPAKPELSRHWREPDAENESHEGGEQDSLAECESSSGAPHVGT